MALLIIMEQKDHTSIKRNFNVYNISTYSYKLFILDIIICTFYNFISLILAY